MQHTWLSSDFLHSKSTNFDIVISIYRVIGAAIIVVGLYALIWGKSKDYQSQSSDDDEKNAGLKLPITATGVEIPTVTKSWYFAEEARGQK